MAGNRRSHMKRANIALLIIAVAAAVVAVALALTGAFRKSNEDFDFGVSESERNETVQEDTGSGSGSGSGNTGSNSDGVENGPIYSLKDGTYEFSWSDTCTDTSIDIPSSYDGVAVTSIADSAFYGCDTVVNVSIPDTVTSIGERAFYGCTSLLSVTIPSSVTQIGSYAFYNCSSLTSAVIPVGVTAIQQYTFYGCTSLTAITIPADVTWIGTYAFYNCMSATEICFDAVAMNDLSLNNYVFCNVGRNTKGLAVTIGAEVTKIPAYIFYPNSSFIPPQITRVIFEDGSICESIGTYAFGYCSALTDITIPSSVTSIGSSAFSGCSSLASITLPFVGGSAEATTASSSTLFGYIFGTSSYDGGTSTRQYYASSSSTTYYIPTSLTSVDVTDGNILYGAFYGCSNIESVTIGSGVTSIGDSAFYNCTSIKGVYISDLAAWCAMSFAAANANPLYYGVNLYLDGSLLVDLVIPEDATSVGDYAFYNCTTLESISMPDGLTTIGSYAFYNCSSLEGVVMPEGLTTIGSYSFRNCAKLETVAIPDSVTSIGSSAFSGCSSLASITLPFVGGSASATTASSSTLFGYIFGTSSYDGGTSTKQYYSSGSSSYSTYYIPTSLTSVTVTGGNILYGAFYSCSNIVSVTIGADVTSIGNSAFYDCTSIEGVYISDLASWCAMSFAAANANPLYYGENLYLDGSLVVDLVIPDDVTAIGNYAFYKCTTLECITIPSDIISIGTYAFYNCTTVTEIYFNAVAMNNLSSNNYVFYNAGKNANGITLTIGSEVTKIPAYIFYPYSSSTSPKITTVIFEDGSQCESIGTYAFANCINLLSFTVPQNCTSIGSSAFYNCHKLVQVNNLSTLNLTLGLDNYGYVAYYAMCVSSDGSDAGAFHTIDDVFVFYKYDGDCNFITYLGTETDITLPDTVDGKSYDIYDFSFSNFTDIENVVLGSGTTSIGSNAFFNCTALKSITMNEGVTSIGADAFYGCSSLESVIVPNSVTMIGGYAFYNCSSLVSLTIGTGVTSIGEYAFYECTALEEIYFNAVAMADLSSGNRVFYNAGKSGSGITVTIGAGVTKIPACLFRPYSSSSYSPKITTVIFENGSQCTSIGNYVFQYCTSLTDVIFKDDSQCASIGSYAFSDCTSLTSIVIPGTVTSVGNYAFDSCKNLSAVYYQGTAEGWNQISISSTGNTYFTSCTIYYYSESQPSENGNYWYFDEDGFPVIWKKL